MFSTKSDKRCSRGETILVYDVWKRIKLMCNEDGELRKEHDHIDSRQRQRTDEASVVDDRFIMKQELNLNQTQQCNFCTKKAVMNSLFCTHLMDDEDSVE